MITIKLSKNNRPTEPGAYLCQRFHGGYPNLVQVIQKNKTLDTISRWGCFPLKDFESGSLWSDRVEVEVGE